MSATAAQYSHPSSGPLYATSWELNGGFVPFSIFRPTARLSDRTARWKLILELLLITNRTTRRGSYSWRISLIIMQNTSVWGTRLLSSIVGTTYTFPTKKTLTPAPSPKQLISRLRNLGISWLHTERTYNTPKNCKNDPIIKKLSLEVTFSARRFSWTANISKPNAIGSWRRSSLGLFEFCTQWVAKPTNSNCQNDGRFMTFSTCYF